MPIPQLGLSLSITDNAGSSMYTGNGEREKMAEFDSALRQHTITITISDEKINEVELEVQKGILNKVKIPTYKMMVTDDKTEEKTYYEVTRDSLLFNKLKNEEIGGFSFLGLNILKKKMYNIPVLTFEPLTSKIEKFEVSKYRTKKQDYLSYNLLRNKESATLVAGKLPPNFFNTIETNHFFYIVDHNEGQKFMGDISYREKFVQITPKVEINLIKRSDHIKEYQLDKRGRINKIIYL
ncbi:hypothetical protein ETU08_06800 [Apibacter muscae]|uniref:Uncharacterized protein n=1 Tax=Apibacter muscae TaxID=2509004 RepID=A0A563DBZ0_9FLAO|nr:hypothetical protein [Apibacter muscae]TWP27730.1 hypothetical protein ETU09_06440 [Apibacter muscae]TWP29550.1 hypothetical protein ETU08_06800 [Apibacter muscae]